MTADYARLVDSFVTGRPNQARWVVRIAHTRGVIGLLPGSFNPPTDAHVALARSGRANGMDHVVYVLSNNTVNKAIVAGIPLADRLRLLADIARGDGDGVIFTNRGLYVEIAEDVRPLIDGEPTFLVGFDKIVQILDPNYYLARPAALDELFQRARIAVAPRNESTDADLAALMARPANRRFAERIATLSLAKPYRSMSSTNVRAGVESRVPPNVADYLAREKPFAN